MVNFIERVKTINNAIKYAWEVSDCADFSSENSPPDDLLICLRPDAFDKLKIRGWKTQAEIASRLDITESILSKVKNGQETLVKPPFIRLLQVTNYLNRDWRDVFYVKDTGRSYDRNHQRWNYQKEIGVMPYDKYSLSADFRNAETRK